MKSFTSLINEAQWVIGFAFSFVSLHSSIIQDRVLSVLPGAPRALCAVPRFMATARVRNTQNFY
jgi:hypothetical protein